MRLDPDTLAEAHWWELAGHARESLTDAWRRAHYAAQAVAEIGKAFAEPMDDDSHTNLAWFDGANILDGFLAGSVVGERRLRAALRFWDMHLFMIDDTGEAHAELDLPGKTLEQAAGWIVDSALNLLDEPVRQGTEPAPDLPDHPVGDGKPFAPPDQFAQAELIRLYANTNAIARIIEHASGDADATRCWPHHFDLATLVNIKREGNDATRTVGVGITPPDSLSESGYWYVSPWRKDSDYSKDKHPGLPFGRWHDRGENSKMALLDISDASANQDKDEQQQRVAAFVAAAFNACADNLTK